MEDQLRDTTESKRDDRVILSEKLADKNNPEMVTFIVTGEVDDIALLQTIGSEIDTKRSEAKLKGNSFLSEYIKHNLIIRTSIQGKRSSQIVETVRGNISAQDNRDMGLNVVQKRILGA